MLAVNPPGHYLVRRHHHRPADRALRRPVRQGRHLPVRTTDVADTIRGRSPDLPTRWGPLPIKPGNVKLATFDGFMHATQASAPLTGPQTIGSWTAAADGDPSGLWLLSLMADLIIPTSHVWGDVAPPPPRSTRQRGGVLRRPHRPRDRSSATRSPTACGATADS